MTRTSTASPSRTHVPLGSLTQPGARALPVDRVLDKTRKV